MILHLRTWRALVASGVVVGAALTGATAPPPARAAGTTAAKAQTGYTCQIQEGNAAQPIATEPMSLQVALDVPTSVAPGQRLALRGMLKLAFPEELSKAANGVFTSADGYSDTMSMQVNGHVLRANRWQTAQVRIGDPIVVSAPISFPPITVPATPGRRMELRMAANGVLKNPYFSTPSPIAFTATASASGPAGTFAFNLACYLTGGTPSVIARIPIAAAPADRAPAGPAGAPAAAAPRQSVPTTGQAPPSAPASGPAGGLAGASGAASYAPPAADGSRPSAAPVATAPLPATQPAADATTEHGVYVPTGLLLGGGAAVVGLSMAYALWAHARLRALQRILDD